MEIRWTQYMIDRLKMRGFDIETVERIVRYSDERYFDVVTGRSVVVGRHRQLLVLIPYEREEQTLIPVTIHVTSRQQIAFRMESGRFCYE
jgi:hypothetical protein